jgi:hypothetical protein
MSTPTLEEVLATPTQAEVLEQEVLTELRGRSVRVTDWLVGGVYRTLTYLVSKLRTESRRVVASLAAAHFEDYAFGFVAAPGDLDVTTWAPHIAKQRYGVDRIEATHTRRRFTLTNASTAEYGPLVAGDIMVSFPSGNRYVLDEDDVTIPASGSVGALFRSEFANDSAAGLSYTDASDSSIVMVTATFPGVTVTNPSTTFSDVSQVGSGVGTVTPSGTPNAPYSIAIRIDSGGQAGGATWSSKVGSGSWVSHGAVASDAIAGTGITATLDDNGGNPAFAAGAVYYFSAPGSDVVSAGRNVETPQELGARCRGLLPSLAFPQDGDGNWIPTSPTMSGYEALARSASDQVKVCFIATGTVNNEVLIYVAGQGTLLGGATLALLQAFFNVFSMATDTPLVASPDAREINLTLAGASTITVRSGARASAQTELQRRLGVYFGGVDPVLPLGINGEIDHAYLVHLIRTTPGVTRFDATTFEINGVVGDLDLPVTPGAFEQASWTEQVATVFDWSTS